MTRAIHEPDAATQLELRVASARLSIVAGLEFLRRQCLATGDIGAECTARLLERVAAEAVTAISEAEIDLLGRTQ